MKEDQFIRVVGFGPVRLPGERKRWNAARDAVMSLLKAAEKARQRETSGSSAKQDDTEESSVSSGDEISQSTSSAPQQVETRPEIRLTARAGADLEAIGDLERVRAILESAKSGLNAPPPPDDPNSGILSGGYYWRQWPNAGASPGDSLLDTDEEEELFHFIIYRPLSPSELTTLRVTRGFVVVRVVDAEDLAATFANVNKFTAHEGEPNEWLSDESLAAFIEESRAR